jgi:hypothetical protein
MNKFAYKHDQSEVDKTLSKIERIFAKNKPDEWKEHQEKEKEKMREIEAEKKKLKRKGKQL